MVSTTDNPADSQQCPTVVIIGAGVFGTSTAYHLAQKYGRSAASKITVVDRAPAPPPPGASTDINKILRADYTSEFYAALGFEALDAWAKWPALKPFYHRTGWILLGAKGSDLAPRIREVFRARGTDPTSDVPLEEIFSRWDGVLEGTSLEGIDHAYANPEAGWCDAAAATESLLAAARDMGVRFVEAEVEGVEVEGGRVVGVKTEKGEVLRAEKTVLATGAWTSSLLTATEDALSLPEAERVEFQAQATGVAVAHYALTSAQREKLVSMPVVVYGEHGEVIPPPDANPLLKFTNVNTFTHIITTSSGHSISIPPIGRAQDVVPEALKRDMRNVMTERVMPSFTRGKEVHSWRLCWDARTPTQDWLLSAHPDPRLEGLFFAIGGSFHSYKFLPNLGKYMVNVLEGKGNGAEADRAWGWKSADSNWRGAHEKTVPVWDLKEIEEKEAKEANGGVNGRVNGHVNVKAE